MPDWIAICKSLNLKLARAQVGDRYVHRRDAEGRLQCRRRAVRPHHPVAISRTTGDGLIAALQVLAVLAQDKKPASEAAHLFEPLPQVLENVRFQKGSPLTMRA